MRVDDAYHKIRYQQLCYFIDDMFWTFLSIFKSKKKKKVKEDSSECYFE